jgi:cardiolipin synthase (CMP-forming)
MLSLGRIVLVIPITVLIYRDPAENFGWIFGLILLALATDWLDGRIARWTGTVSEWGKVLDPMADKLAAASVTLALVARGDLPVWFVVLVVARDALIAIGGVAQTRRIGYVMPSLWSGKVAVNLLALTVLAALLGADPEIMQVLLWSTSAVLVYSYGRYLQRFFRIMRLVPPETLPGENAPAEKP